MRDREHGHYHEGRRQGSGSLIIDKVGDHILPLANLEKPNNLLKLAGVATLTTLQAATNVVVASAEHLVGLSKMLTRHVVSAGAVRCSRRAFSSMPGMVVFNRDHKLRQRNRAAARPDYDRFTYIRDHLAEQIVDRLQDIMRTFPGRGVWCRSYFEASSCSWRGQGRETNSSRQFLADA